jgi:hypothetical protein
MLVQLLGPIHTLQQVWMLHNGGLRIETRSELIWKKKIVKEFPYFILRRIPYSLHQTEKRV